MKRFDRKFGAGLLAGLPTSPGVYLFKDDRGEVLYVGKARNLRERLSDYRSASRRKVHRKMRTLVREAATLEVRVQPTEVDALTVENQLIRELMPSFNVDGKYSFMYPAIGVRRSDRHTLFCLTTNVGAWEREGLRWFGAFRSRPRTREAFDALVELLGLIGHLEPMSALEIPHGGRGARLAGLRQLPAELVAALEGFLSGESRDGLVGLATALLEKPRARRDSAVVQEQLERLDAFFAADLQPLHAALRRDGRPGTFVPQAERDTLFIRTRG